MFETNEKPCQRWKQLPSRACYAGCQDPETHELDPHLCCDRGPVQAQENQVRLIMCSSLDDVVVGEHHDYLSFGMRCYKHSRHVLAASNEDNCMAAFTLPVEHLLEQ